MHRVVKIRKATLDNFAAMVALDRESPTAAHWSEHQYQDLFAPAGSGVPRLALVAELPDARLAGFLVARHLAPEWELENIVVAPSEQRTGVGKRLLEGLLAAARQTHSHTVFLEVRESNAAARGLYEKLGFRETGRRKSYYANPVEDAVLYAFALG